MLTRTVLLETVRQFAPFTSDSDAERAVDATLATLGEQLTGDELAWLCREFDEDLERVLRSCNVPSCDPVLDRTQHEFVGQVAAREGVWRGLAHEHIEVVLGAAGRGLPGAVRQRLERHLPQLAKWLEWRPRPSTPSMVRHRPPGSAHDLAEGRPGGTHPIASSDTSTLAHRHSVARSNDPHADTKVSSSTGVTQEREGHTLATGHPGSDNPLSRGH